MIETTIVIVAYCVVFIDISIFHNFFKILAEGKNNLIITWVIIKRHNEYLHEYQ